MFFSNLPNKYERPSFTILSETIIPTCWYDGLRYYDHEVVMIKSYLFSWAAWDGCLMRAASIDDQSTNRHWSIDHQQDVGGKSPGDLGKRIRL